MTKRNPNPVVLGKVPVELGDTRIASQLDRPDEFVVINGQLFAEFFTHQQRVRVPVFKEMGSSPAQFIPAFPRFYSRSQRPSGPVIWQDRFDDSESRWDLWTDCINRNGIAQRSSIRAFDGN